MKGERKGRRKVAEKAKQLERLAVEYVPIQSIKPNTYNPNRQDEHDFELLKRSMEEDGFTQPVIVQQATREIVDGFHRWRAAMELGHTEIPVVFVDMTPEQMKIATLRHNRARGTEDLELTADLMRDLERLGALDWAQDSLMLDDLEIQRLIEDVPAPEALAAEEYSEAWAPDQVSGAEQEALQAGTATVESVDTVGPDGERTIAMSQAAVDALMDRERKLREARTEEERAAARQDGKLYRVSLAFHGEEAVLVRAVLGHRPAERLVELCRGAAAP